MRHIFALILPLSLLLSMSSCDRNKQISYVEMLQREEKEINAFLQKEGIQVVNEIQPDQPMPENQFAKVKEGIYVNIKSAGNGNKPVSGETIVQARFVIESVADPNRTKNLPTPLFNNYAGAVGGTHPLNFTYIKGATAVKLDPTTPSDNMGEQVRYGCAAMIEALNYVTEGGEVRVITSFRNGPNMGLEKGIPMFYRVIHFTFKK